MSGWPRSTSTPAWWEGVAPLETPGPPGAEDHRLVWRASEFRLANHPDPEAERALVALGGERCPCLDVLEAWHGQHVAASILTVGARYPEEELELNGRVANQLRAEIKRWRSHLAALRSEARRRGDRGAADRLARFAAPAQRAAAERLALLHVLSLPPALQLRLQASVAATLAVEGRLDRLTAPTATRAQPALRAVGWLGRPADVELTDDLSTAVVAPERVVLPAGWVAEVWARGLAEVEGTFVVAVLAVVEGGSALDVLATEAEGKSLVALRVERWENGWRRT